MKQSDVVKLIQDLIDKTVSMSKEEFNSIKLTKKEEKVIENNYYKNSSFVVLPDINK